MANVFISHRKSDDKLAEQLATELRDAGHQVWFDEWEIALGDSIVGRMDEGLKGTTHVVMCFSSDGVDSAWMSTEWHSALTAQLNGEGVKLLPIRLSGGDPPAVIRHLKYADLVKDWHFGLNELLMAIK